MMDPKQDVKQQLSKNCRERVTEVRLKSAITHLFAGQTLLQTGKADSGVKVDAMALHPGGVMVLFKGRRIVVAYEYAVIAEDEV